MKLGDTYKLETKILPEDATYQELHYESSNTDIIEVDKDGNLKVQNDYDMVTELNEYGFAGIKKDGKWGVIDENGQVVQEPIYVLDEISPSFIGKYYKVDEWYGNAYYTDEVDEEMEENNIN